MPTQNGNGGEQEVFAHMIRNGDNESLVLAKTEAWCADGSAEIYCEEGHVDLTEWQ